MKIKIEIKSIFGAVLFVFEKENNSILTTLKEAVKNGASLSGADLSRANLSGADLSRANLYGANLSGADLSRASLYGANLSGADLYGANLSGADLSRASLYGANLSGADLSRASLYGANLSGANLSGADLYGANLSGANLSGANLSGANLSGADLSGANLSGANLSGAIDSELVIARTRILPDEGDVIGWKKARVENKDVIVKLLIPSTAKRSHAFGRKCRASEAKVLEISGNHYHATSQYDKEFKYEVGKTVKPDEPFNENWISECESGIHFYITKIEAENYV